jgi:CheY-like chemotaxis protein
MTALALTFMLRQLVPAMETAHILIIDDHRDIRDLLARYLTKHGYRVSTADGSAAARRLLDKGAIELVVLDVMMPGEDGLSLCRHLRATSEVPVILLTAMAERNFGFGAGQPLGQQPRRFPPLWCFIDFGRAQFVRLYAGLLQQGEATRRCRCQNKKRRFIHVGPLKLVRAAI